MSRLLSASVLLLLAACTCRPPDPAPPAAVFSGLSPQPGVSALALGLSAPDFGLRTVWLEIEDDAVRRGVVEDGLRLLTPAGPRHRQEIAARAARTCIADRQEDCALLLARVVEGDSAEAARADLLRQAEAEVTCAHAHELVRVQSASPQHLTLVRAEGSATCAEDGGGYDVLEYGRAGWSGEEEVALPEAWLAEQPLLADELAEDAAGLVRERAAGIRRVRVAAYLQDGLDGVEVSVLLEESQEPADFTEILARWPDATDVLVSPDQGVLVVVRPAALVAVRVRDGAPLWEAPVAGRIVMAEWVRGEAEVAAWATQALGLAAGAR